MIRQKLTLSKYAGWEIYAYYAVSTYYTDEIMEHLWYLGVNSSNAKRAYKNLSSDNLDTGLCYSNPSQRKSIIVVAKTSSASEFLNSLTHEVTHACVHIATELGVNMQSEDFAYMVGEMCRDMYDDVKHLLCDCCRNEYGRHN